VAGANVLKAETDGASALWSPGSLHARQDSDLDLDAGALASLESDTARKRLFTPATTFS